MKKILRFNDDDSDDTRLEYRSKQEKRKRRIKKLRRKFENRRNKFKNQE